MIFSFIWSAGGNLHDNVRENSRVKFSSNLRTKILKIQNNFPFEGEVYDYLVNFEKGKFMMWKELMSGSDWKYHPKQAFFNILVPTADTVKYQYLLKKLIVNEKNALVSGETGVGKSVIIQEFLKSLDIEKYVFQNFNFSAQTNSKNILDIFMDKDKFTKKGRDLLGPPAGRKMVVFIDDINMPALEEYGAQPPIELLRQVIDHGGFYDLKKLEFMRVKDCYFIAACAPPGGGRNTVTPRLYRHFNMLWIPQLS